jgi:tRNA G18 (ribose-2'-O)-methylase SpoU
VPIFRVDDPADARLEDYRNVPDARLIAERGIFVAEGRLVVRRLLEDGRFRARSVLVTEAALNGDPIFRLKAEATAAGVRAEATAAGVRAEATAAGAPAEATGADSLPVFVVPQWIINAVTGFNIHRGCLAIGERPAPQPWQEVAAPARRLVVVERVADADNVGAIFRNAAAFGVDAVLLEARCTDPLYRKAIRTSMGAALRVPFARVAPWPAALLELRALGWMVVALTPSGETTLADMTGPAEAGRYVHPVPSGFSRKVAIVLGHEGDGLSNEALDACDVRARIPMAPGADSLNVATACAIALYDFRQKADATGGRDV